MKRKNAEFERNQIKTSLAVFIENYNESIPKGFPSVTIKALKEFQTTHPKLFKKNNEWSIDKHRKRLMDWLSSHLEFL